MVVADSQFLLLLRHSPLEALDLQRPLTGFLGDFAVLFQDIAACGFVAVEAAEQVSGHAHVGALGAFITGSICKILHFPWHF